MTARQLVVLCTAAALSACASSSIRERPSDDRYGLGPDLRIFADDACLDSAPAVRGGLGLAGELVKGVASLAMKSFGRFLEETGSPEIETATGVYAALMLDNENDPPGLNPALRCLYIVRDGFERRGFDTRASESTVADWRRLGLTGTPSLYMKARLDPALDGSNYFRATALDFTVTRFARAGAEGTRDLVVVLEFVIPSGGRQYRVNQQGDIVFDPVGPFARGAFALRGVNNGSFLGAADLRGVETGWMTGPPSLSGVGQLPVNLYVDVVEMKRGNPFLADLGRFLQSPAISNAAADEAYTLIDERGREQAATAESIELEKTERRLVYALEAVSLDLRETLADDASPRELLDAAQKAESAIGDVDFQRRSKGWRSTYPEALIGDISALASRARTRATASN